MPVISRSSLQEQVDEDTESLNKESCHDSGIDIRESSLPPIPPPIPNKKVSNSNDCINDVLIRNI